MHPAFATRRGTRPRGEANLLAIITSKHVSWSNGSAGRPASLEFVAPRFRACLLSSRTFQRERKMDRGGRKREREGASTALQVAVCTHRPYTDARKRASPPLPSHPLTLRSRSGPWNPVLDIKQDQICRVAPPNRCMYAQDQVQSTGRRNHGITFIIDPRAIGYELYEGLRFSSEISFPPDHRVYIYIYISSILLRFHLSFIFFPRYFFEINLSQYFVYKRKGITFFS